MRHVRKIDESAVLFYRLHTGTSTIDTMVDIASFDENHRLAFHRTEVVAAAAGEVAVGQRSQTSAKDVVAAKLAVGFHVCVARYISGISAAMNLKQHESGLTDFPRQTADVVTAEYVWIALAAIITSEIEFLVFLRQLEIVVVEVIFKVEICFKVFVLIEIAVFYAVDC